MPRQPTPAAGTRTLTPRRPASGAAGPPPVPPLDYLLLALAVSGVAASAPLISATAAPALAIAFWRNCMAAGVLGPIALLRRTHRTELRELLTGLLRHGRRDLPLACLAGLFLAVHFGLWLPSLRMTSVAASTALCTTTPLWTTVFLRLRGHRAPLLTWVGVCLAFGGVLVLTGFDLTVSTRALTGDLMALAAGIAAAGYFLIGSHVRRTVSTTGYTTVCYSTTAVTMLLTCLFSGQALTGYSAADWWKIIGLTVAAQFVGHTLSNRVVGSLGAPLVSTAILLETPLAAVIAGIWLGQVPSAAVYPAVAMVLAGLVLVIRANRSS